MPFRVISTTILGIDPYFVEGGIASRRLPLGALYNHVLQVARTIADIEGNEQFVSDHVSEANQDRRLERRFK